MNIALILAGGTGTRLGEDIPKQYLKVEGKPIIRYCLDTVFAHTQIDAVQIVADISWHIFISQCIPDQIETDKWKGFSKPGANRQLSILHGLEDILSYASPNDLVMIHDAARPLLSAAFITKCLESAAGHDGVLPVLPMKDTVYYSKNGYQVSSLIKRESIFAGQAPELFRLEPYYKANQDLLPNQILEINGSTEPAILAGMDIVMVNGEEENFKITTKEDLERFRQKLQNAPSERRHR